MRIGFEQVLKAKFQRKRGVHCEQRAISSADILSAKLIKFTDNWRADFPLDS
jgi:hypothetical protein